jgi:transcriptional regulator with XRE-family HTH domain
MRADTKTDSGIRQRFAELVAKHTQSEIARATGTPISSVNRYMHGARIPADFCAALVRGLGVNPSWLLAGEGSPSLSDVPDNVSGMADELISMVRAMGEVSRMRLGSLTGKHHLRVLRELSDALGRHEELRLSLREQLGPFVKELLASYRAAIHRYDATTAADLRKALEQVFRFHDVPQDRREFDLHRAHEAYIGGDLDAALAFQRGVFGGHLSSGHVDLAALAIAQNLCVGLQAAGRIAECRRVALAALDLSIPDVADSEDGRYLDAIVGFCDVHTGRLRDGLPRILHAYSRASAGARGPMQLMLIQASLLAGTLDMNAALEMALTFPQMGNAMCRFAAWLEDGRLLDRVIQRFVGTDANHTPPDRLSPAHAIQVRDLLTGRGKLDDAAYLRWEDRGYVGLIESLVLRCRRDILAGRKVPARKLHAQAATLLAKSTPDYLPEALTEALHHRNALDLFPAESAARDAAADYFTSRREAGYGLFAALDQTAK